VLGLKLDRLSMIALTHLDVHSYAVETSRKRRFPLLATDQ
jgi:hypothetical protein